MMSCPSTYKSVQRKYYDVLSYKYSTIVFIPVVIVFCISLYTFYNKWVADKKTNVSSYWDNISGKSFQQKLCQAIPIDVVYTWVNGSDPKFLESLQVAMGDVKDAHVRNDTTSARFRDKEELRYSLRSLEKFAPWVRHVYIVTNGQIPYWLDLESPHITLVTHSDIFPDENDLPTFSSPAIEAHLHRLPGLSETFLYFNDDVFLGKEIWPEDFFTLSKGFKVFFSWNIPDCSSECPWAWVGDGSCDPPCNTQRCDFDGGDCKGKNNSNLYPKQPSAVASAVVDYEDSDLHEEIRKVQSIYNNLQKNDTIPMRKLFSVDENPTKLPFYNLRKRQLISAPESNRRLTSRKSTLETQIRPMNAFKKKATNQSAYNVINFKRRRLRSMSVMNSEKVLQRVRMYPKLKVNEDAGVIDLMKKENVNISEAVRLSNKKYMERKKEFKGLRRSQLKIKKMSKKRDRRDEGGNMVVKIDAKELSNWSGGKLLEGKVAVNGSNQAINSSDLSIKLMAKPDWRELKLMENKEERRLDMFGESLLHVHRLYNKEFGVQIRKVPAHMPHLINKNIMEQLQLRFYKEWTKTSRHKFRHNDDMQLAFSYFHYLVSLSVNRTVDEIFDEFDTDESGTWSDREIRTLLTRIYGTPLTLPAVVEFEDIINNCSARLGGVEDVTAAPYDRYIDSKLPPVTRKLVNSCKELVEVLHEEFPARKVHKTEILYDKQQDGVFKGLVNNLSQVLDTLDFIRANQRKFICLNDNIQPNESNSEEDIIMAVLQDFYQSLYPARSKFELPPQLRNRFLHMSEYVAWKEAQNRFYNGVALVFIVACVGCTYACFQNEIHIGFRKLRKRRSLGHSRKSSDSDVINI